MAAKHKMSSRTNIFKGQSSYVGFYMSADDQHFEHREGYWPLVKGTGSSTVHSSSLAALMQFTSLDPPSSHKVHQN